MREQKIQLLDFLLRYGKITQEQHDKLISDIK